MAGSHPVDDVLERIDLFCDTVPRTWARAADHGPLRLFTRDGPGWPFYARPVPGGGPVTASDVERVRARQRAATLPEAFEWVLAAAPTMAGATSAAGLPVQVCPLLVLDGPPAPAPLPPGFRVRLLGPADGDLPAAAHAVRAVASAAFGAPPPPMPTDADLVELRRDLAAGAVAKALVTGPDGPVASGAAQRAGDVVELVGIGTAAAARGRGLGAAVTAALATVARHAGADLVFLAAADDAASRVYQRVDFRHVGECGIAELA
jgi:ribosomal protein S18 acetylase RimI-like enzyme